MQHEHSGGFQGRDGARTSNQARDGKVTPAVMILLLVALIAVASSAMIVVLRPARPASAPPQVDRPTEPRKPGEPGVGSVNPVRFLIPNQSGSSFQIVLCDSVGAEVLVRHYRTYPGGGAPEHTRRLTVTGSGGTYENEHPGLIVTAQAIDLESEQGVGDEVGPGQTGTCPP